MKIRNGFVSNSSSSSFIIAVKDNGSACPTCGRGGDGFLEMFPKGRLDYEETKIRAEGSETIINNIIDIWGKDMGDCDVRDEMGKLRGEMDAYEKMGYRVAFIEISYHDETMNDEWNKITERNDKSLIIVKNYN